jgi:5-methylcytosine-specific restriction endonuclease McrA
MRDAIQGCAVIIFITVLQLVSVAILAWLGDITSMSFLKEWCFVGFVLPYVVIALLDNIFGGRIDNLNNEQRKVIQKYVKSKIRESIKEYQQDTKYREVKQVERDRDIREVCLMRAGYQCEINSEHTSFTATNGRQYVESHHIIPLKYQDQFNFNLDTVDNLIALCPNCHKAIHYGSRRTKELLLKQIYSIRPIAEYEKLLSFYK